MTQWCFGLVKINFLHVIILIICTNIIVPIFAEDSAFITPITPNMLDNSTTAEWIDGKEVSRSDFLDQYNKVHWPNQLTWFVIMPKSRLGFNGISFGNNNTPGKRYFRAGLLQPVAAGTIITRGKLSGVSVLKQTAAYPGDMGDDNLWIPAERTHNEEISTWILPPGTTTRAFRFTYDSPADDRNRAGTLQGMYVISKRYQNIAASSLPMASQNNNMASLLTDGEYNQWNAWTNGSNLKRPVISTDYPEWVTLVWQKNVTLQGLCAVWALFGKIDVQTYTGPDDLHPKEADDAQWQTVTTGSCYHNYPSSCNLNWLDFGKTITTRAIRIRIISSVDEGFHGDLKGKTENGKRCLLGEVMAMSPLGNDSFKTGDSIKNDENTVQQPPIPIKFSIPEAGFVSLVLEDATGKRVRNLISDTLYKAGENIVYWDGLDESGRIEGPYAGIYKMVGQPVSPGTYTIRGLYHRQFNLKYEFSVNSPGTPPWLTGSHWGGGTGGWLADHSTPAAVLSLPGDQPKLLMTSPVAESSHGIIWTDLTGKKMDGKLWVGGNWTGASHLTRDNGPQAIADTYAYSGIVWEGGLRLVAFKSNSYPVVAPYSFIDKAKASLGGLAAYNGLLTASMPKTDNILLIDANAGKIIGLATLPDGRGLTFDKQGRLLALSGTRLLRYPVIQRETLNPVDKDNIKLPEPEILISQGLSDPQGITIDNDANIYISDWGTSHQVKVFKADGTPLRVIGAPGGAKTGSYDPMRMDHPQGMTISADNHLWVAEASYAPKRVSRWSIDGKLVNAFYGPPQYGGGGSIDPQDTTRFYYGEQGHNTGLEFALDWTTGTSKLKSIYYMPKPDDLKMPNNTAPQTAIYINNRQYMTDVNNSSPIGGPRCASIWMMSNGMAKPVASLGMAKDWAILNDIRYKDAWPKDMEPKKAGWETLMYSWSDLNTDSQITSEELTFAKYTTGSLTVNDRLEFCTAGTEIFTQDKFTAQGIPVYDLSKGTKQLENFFMREVWSGSGQIAAARDGWTIGTGGMLRGIRGGKIVWTYPNEWPGQQAGVFSVPPTHRGELMATTRHMGIFNPAGSDAGEILVIQGDKGNFFLMTTDGLFVATIFNDVRLTSNTWTMAETKRGMVLNDITLYDEDFWSTATQTKDGKYYFVAGKSHSSIIKFEGLESTKRIKPWELKVTQSMLDEAQQFRIQQESARLARVGRDRLTINITAEPPVIDSNISEWNNDEWVTIDERANARLNKEIGGKVEASLRISAEQLCIAYKTNEPNLLANAGDSWQMLFKTGGALDIMIGANPNASPKRTKAETGDSRVLITMMNKKPIAVLYQPVSQDVKAPASFSSPWRTINFDRVEDISTKITYAAKNGSYEISIPLSILGLSPKDNLDIRGDIGILRGNGFQTMQRLYWQNKATSTVADVPTEATLTPHLWGIWHFRVKNEN